MPGDCSFHRAALAEYAEAARYYLREASPQVAGRFVAAVESAPVTLSDAPARWRSVEEPEIRRCILNGFPFVIYYRWEPRPEHVTIYAMMHGSREPGYWRDRLETAT